MALVTSLVSLARRHRHLPRFSKSIWYNIFCISLFSYARNLKIHIENFQSCLRQIVSATRRHNSLTELRKEEENEQERPWTMQTKKSDGIVRTRLFFNPKYFSAARTEMMPTRAKYICSKEPLDRTIKLKVKKFKTTSFNYSVII